MTDVPQTTQLLIRFGPLKLRDNGHWERRPIDQLPQRYRVLNRGFDEWGVPFIVVEPADGNVSDVVESAAP